VETDATLNEPGEGMLRRYTGPGSRDLRRLWPPFRAALDFYFPPSSVTRVRRFLRLARRPDYSKGEKAVAKLLADAVRTRESNREKWAELFKEPAPEWLAELRTVSFQQFQDELRAIEAFGDAFQAARAGNSSKRRRSASRAHYLVRRCDQNRRQLTQLVYDSLYKSTTDDNPDG
jgi:hypothetical protein